MICTIINLCNIIGTSFGNVIGIIASANTIHMIIIWIIGVNISSISGTSVNGLMLWLASIL